MALQILQFASQLNGKGLLQVIAAGTPALLLTYYIVRSFHRINLHLLASSPGRNSLPSPWYGTYYEVFVGGQGRQIW